MTLFEPSELLLLSEITEAEAKLIDLDTLVLLADIKDDLRYRIAYRQLRMEVIDANMPIAGEGRSEAGVDDQIFGAGGRHE